MPHRYSMLSLEATCSAVAGVSGYVFAQATTSTEARGGAAFIALSLGTLFLGRVFDEVAERRKRRAVLEDRSHQAALDRQAAELDLLRRQVRAVSAKTGSNEGKSDASLKILSGSGIRPSPPPPASAPEGTAYPVVLVVEDDPTSARILSRQLPLNGYEVVHAATVADALAYVDVVPAVVLLDLNLPDGSGLAVLEAIRARNLPSRVFIMTGSADEATMERVRALAPERVYLRPFSFNLIVEDLKAPAPPDGVSVPP
jgi:CheY-like chemotaxis protein